MGWGVVLQEAAQVAKGCELERARGSGEDGKRAGTGAWGQSRSGVPGGPPIPTPVGRPPPRILRPGPPLSGGGICVSLTCTCFSSFSFFFLGWAPRGIHNQPLSADTRGEKVLSSLCEPHPHDESPSHPTSHRGHRAAPRAGGSLLCWPKNSKRRAGRRVGPVGQEPALVLTRAPFGWEAREVRQGQPGDPGPGLMWVPDAAGRAQVPLQPRFRVAPRISNSHGAGIGDGHGTRAGPVGSLTSRLGRMNELGCHRLQVQKADVT